jgi:uncharacterized membrane protein YeaQ/YmgE (transglycosylase-associated protein family)
VKSSAGTSFGQDSHSLPGRCHFGNLIGQTFLRAFLEYRCPLPIRPKGLQVPLRSQSVDLENSPAPQIQGCLKASHLQLGPELLFWLLCQIIPFQYGDLVLKLGMGIFSWIILGLIAGALAKFIMPGKDPGGIFVTILIGIAGAIVGGFVGSFIGLGKVESFDLGGIFIATIGAIILLIVYRLLRKRT